MKREENLTRMNAKARIFVQISQETASSKSQDRSYNKHFLSFGAPRLH